MCPEPHRHRGKLAQHRLTRPCPTSTLTRLRAIAPWFGHGEAIRLTAKKEP